jgi:hypothetical protein
MEEKEQGAEERAKTIKKRGSWTTLGMSVTIGFLRNCP